MMVVNLSITLRGFVAASLKSVEHSFTDGQQVHTNTRNSATVSTNNS